LKNTDFTEIGDRCLALARERAEGGDAEAWMPGEVVPYRVPRREWADLKIPSRYRDYAFENFKGNDTLSNRIRSAVDRKESLVLIGNTGCGKTHLAIAAMRHGVEAGTVSDGALFIPVPELLMKIRATFRDGAQDTEEDVIDRYSHCPFLILDDLGAEKTSEFSIATLELILDRRIRDNRPMIVTTNLTLEEIEGRLSARIASRLSITNCIKINMPDWRKRR